MKNYTECFNRGIFYLRYGTPSVKKMGFYLKDKGYNKDEIEASIKKMLSLGYLDDYKLAMETIEKMTNQGKGIYAIKSKLFSKEIPEGIISDSLEDSDILKIQKNLAIKQVKKDITGKKLDKNLIIKISRRLKYLGYSNNIVYDIENQLKSKVNDDI